MPGDNVADEAAERPYLEPGRAHLVERAEHQPRADAAFAQRAALPYA